MKIEKNKQIDKDWDSYYRGQHETEVYYNGIVIPQERKKTAEENINKLEQLQRCLKQVALNDLIISLRKQYNLDVGMEPKPESEPKLITDSFYDIQSCDDKCKCPHCEEYFYKSKIGFKVEDTERYFYCPQCGGRVLLK